MNHKKSQEQSTELFQKAQPFLNEINYTGLLPKEELCSLIKKARYVDVRVRCEGREYYFEADFLKDLLHKVDEIQTRKILLEKNINETE